MFETLLVYHQKKKKKLRKNFILIGNSNFVTQMFNKDP